MSEQGIIEDPRIVQLREAVKEVERQNAQFRELCHTIAEGIYKAIGEPDKASWCGYGWGRSLFPHLAYTATLEELEKFIEDVENGLFDRIREEYEAKRKPKEGIVERAERLVPVTKYYDPTLLRPASAPLLRPLMGLKK